MSDSSSEGEPKGIVGRTLLQAKKLIKKLRVSSQTK